MAEQPIPDHRKFPRRAFIGRVELIEYIHGRQSVAVATDINPMGMRLDTKRVPTMGEVLTLKFPSPKGDYDLTVSGEVMRIEKGACGVEFFGLEDWIFEELCAYVYGVEYPGSLILEAEEHS
ncbi:MAG: hypothetical protein ACI9OJ_004799 [Myxococcota bacterium]|jgi:hypothetical protein